MYCGMKQSFTRILPILTIFAIQAQTSMRNGVLQHIRQRISKMFSHLCYLGLFALDMYVSDTFF